MQNRRVAACLVLLFSAFVASSSSAALIETHFNQNPAFHFTEPYSHRTRAGENFEDIVIHQIREAKTQVWVAVHELMLPQIAETLVAAQSSGVRVRVIIENQYHVAFSQLTPEQIANLNPYLVDKYHEFLALADAYGDRDGKPSLAEQARADAIFILEAAHVPLTDDTADGSKGAELMHHKFMTIDDGRVVVASANFTSSDFFGDFASPRSLGNPNGLVVIESPALNRLFREEFDQMWGDSSRRPRFGVKKAYRPAMTVHLADGTPVTVQFSPFGKKVPEPDTTNGLIADVLSHAKSRIDFSLFVFSEQRISDVLEKVREQGVDVRGLIEPSFAYRYYSELLDMLGLVLFDPKCRLEAGTHPWAHPISSVGIPVIPEGDKFHHKFAVVDGRRVIFGSHNWSDAANRGNDETLLVIDDERSAQAFDREFERAYQHSVLGVPSWLKKRADEDEKRCRSASRIRS
ncbi:MAG: competence protein ComE [Cryobacterium sp.]|nr:competence protein ComE [Oligoflexia bacterium]